MKTSDILIFLGIIATVIFLLGWPMYHVINNPPTITISKVDPCIEKETQWDPETQQQIHIWTIEGTKYLVRKGPNGGSEIVGKYSRFYQ